MADFGKVALLTKDFMIVETAGMIQGKKRKVKIDACYFYKDKDGAMIVKKDAVIEELH